MRVLVTGAAGFLGRHVSQHFRDAGWGVRGFDLSRTEIEGVEPYIGDFTQQDNVRDAVADMDVVIHIGAIGDVYLAGEQPELAATVNVTGSSIIASAAAEAGARLVYASTWEVYGEPKYEPLDENHPTNPDHPYSITKLAGEAMVLSAADLGGAPSVALRLGTAYGSGLRPNSVFRIFIDRARNGEPITIQGDGSQGRQFTHARDIARAFELAAVSSLTGEVFNIVAPESTSIKELADVVSERFPTDVSFGEPRPGDVTPATVSAAKAQTVFGWEPTVMFADGMDELIASVVKEI